MDESTYTFTRPEIADAMKLLFSRNIVYLIEDIYSRASPFTDPAVRSGLVIKLLLKSSHSVPLEQDVLDPVVEDIMGLLENTENDGRSKLMDQLRFVQSFVINDDLITLNTTK